MWLEFMHYMNMGGVYLDTDVEVIRNFTSLLEGKSAVLGVEDEYKTIGTGFLAFEPKHEICYEMLNYYRNNSFSSQSKSMSNTQILADLIKKKYNIKLADKVQVLDKLVVYPSCYFTAYNGYTGKTEIADDTCCVHHFSASWHGPVRKFKDEIKKRVHRIMTSFH